jgi:hypothetical protein
MAKVVFWSPEANMTGNTHVALAVSTLMGIVHKAKCILMQGHFNSRKIETSFTPYDELKSSGVLNNSDIGIGALTKIIVSNKLTASTIKNYAKPVLKDRLDVLYGMTSKEKEQYLLMASNLQFIVRKADEIYDLVFVDLPKQNTESYIKETLEEAELVVCIVNQDLIKLDEFFDLVSKEEELKNKEKLYIIGDYESNSKYNVSNIRKKYKISDPIFTIPHNYLFSDACNDGNIIDFFYKNLNAEKSDYNGYFVSEVSKVVEKVIEMTKIKDY